MQEVVGDDTSEDCTIACLHTAIVVLRRKCFITGLDISSAAIARNSFQICPTVRAIVDDDENILGIFCHVPKYAQKPNDSPWLNFELRTRHWPAGQMLMLSS